MDQTFRHEPEGDGWTFTAEPENLSASNGIGPSLEIRLDEDEADRLLDVTCSDPAGTPWRCDRRRLVLSCLRHIVGRRQ